MKQTQQLEKEKITFHDQMDLQEEILNAEIMVAVRRRQRFVSLYLWCCLAVFVHCIGTVLESVQSAMNLPAVLFICFYYVSDYCFYLLSFSIECSREACFNS